MQQGIQGVVSGLGQAGMAHLESQGLYPKDKNKTGLFKNIGGSSSGYNQERIYEMVNNPLMYGGGKNAPKQTY
jgi:hypothetical protein